MYGKKTLIENDMTHKKIPFFTLRIKYFFYTEVEPLYRVESASQLIGPIKATYADSTADSATRRK